MIIGQTANKEKKAAVFTNIGAMLEYFDFIIFPYIMPYICSVFFVDNSISSFIKLLLIFASGSISRIFGTFILGSLSQKSNSAYVMITSISMMSVSTFLIGILPSYSSIGYLSPILLLLLRFIQGIAYCAEMPVASSFIFDYYKNNVGRKIAHLLISTTLGAVIAAYSMYFMTKIFDDSSIKNYAWRLPFLIASMIGFYILYLRISFLPNINTPLPNKPILDLFDIFKNEKTKIIKSIILFLMPASMIMIYIFLPRVFISKLGFSSSISYLASTIGLLFSILVAIYTGSKMHSKKYFKICFLAFLILYPGSWLLLLPCNILLLFLFVCVFQFFLTTFMMVALFNINTSFYKSQHKTVIIVLYNLAFVTASIIPILTEYINPICVSYSVPVLVCIFIILKNYSFNFKMRN